MGSRQEPRVITPAVYPNSQYCLPHEYLEHYTTGGLHPVNLGDTFQDGRYRIAHKLGYGGSSTVWLACDRDGARWVSIKVKTGRASTVDLDEDREIRNLRKLQQYHADSPQDGPMPFARLLDCFQHPGPNGTHNCLVTELVGPSISDVLYWCKHRNETLRPDLVLRASCQLLDALSFFHRAGLVHGDVSNANVAFICHFDGEQDLFDALGDPVTADYISDEIPWSPELPRHIVGSSTWSGWYEDPGQEIRLLDMGEAFPIDSMATKIAQPRDVRPPETFFIGSFDHRLDIWRAGCVIHSLYYQEKVLRSGLGHEAYYIKGLVEKLGPLPECWRGKWDELKSQCSDIEEFGSEDPIEPLTETFEPRLRVIESSWANGKGTDERDEYTDYDLAALSSLSQVLIGLFQHEPDKRLALAEAVSHIRSNWVDHRRDQRPEEPKVEEQDLL